MMGMDKVLHFVVSFMLAGWDVGLAAAAGIGKEIYDFFGGGTADIYDLLADGLGIVTRVLWG